MINLYLKSIFRQIARQRLLASIKVVGLAAGLGTFLLMSLFVLHEINFDRQHRHPDRLYRYVHRVNTPEGLQGFAFASATIGPALKDRYPEVEAFTRMLTNTVTVKNTARDIGFNELRFGFVEANFLEFFSFPVNGESHPEQLLKEPYSLVISPKIAERYFGDENPVGKSLIVNGQMNFVVKGVLQENMNRSHIYYDILASYATLESIRRIPSLSAQMPASLNLDAKGFSAFYTYLRLAPGSLPETLIAKFPSFIEDFRGKGRSERLKPTLQAVTSIHLDSQLLYEIDQNGSMRSVWIFFGIGFSILLIACINYINLSTAEFLSRGKSIGLKKILGIKRIVLFAGHFAETVALTLIAVSIGVALAWLFLPYFNELVNRRIAFGGPYLPILVGGVLIITSALSGIYPAVAILRIGSLQEIRGVLPSGLGVFSLRNSLVFFQILVSFCLLSVTLLIFNQLAFLLDKDLGIATDRVMVVNGNGTTVLTREAFKERLMNATGIVDVSGCSIPPGQTLSTLGLKLRENSDDERRIAAYQCYVDAAYLRTLGIKLLGGRNFDEHNPSDSLHYILINHSAAELLADSSGRILDREIEVPDLFGGGSTNRKSIIGVLNDYHFESLHKTVEPLILEYNPGRATCQLVRFDSEARSDLVHFMEKSWKETNPTLPFDFYYLDQGLAKWYDSEQRLKGTVLFFSCLAVCLAALGLFGTTLFTVQQKTREIGIRKVLGSGPGRLCMLLVKPLSILILLACVLGIPLSYWASDLWLNQFAYRVAVNPLVFADALILILGSVIISLIYHFMKISTINPVDVLRER